MDTYCFIRCLKKMHNWAAPGPDGVQDFWIKRFPSLHEGLVRCFNDMLSDSSTIPSWLPTGRTMLIPKNRNSDSAKNYKPITYLNTVYKL